MTNTPTDEDARSSTQKLLLKWRPHILEESKPQPEPEALPEAKAEAESQPPPIDTVPETNGIKSPNPDKIVSDANGGGQSEPKLGGGPLSIAGIGAGADTEGKTERGGSVVAAVG